MAGFVNRENRVPHYQRLFQQGQQQHIRQWMQTPKSKVLLYPYFALFYGSLTASVYMMSRQVLGYKTWV
ncbi:hypothetical protein B7463_g6365, partial [Scytalidium lignicola]